MVILMTGLAIALTSSEYPYWVPIELRDADLFSVHRGAPPGESNPQVFTFRRIATGVVIDLIVSTSTPAYREPRWMYATEPSNIRTIPSSGVPIGKNVRLHSYKGHLNLTVSNNWERCRALLFSPMIVNGRSRRIRPDDHSDKEEWLESIVRQAMGRFASRRAGAINIRAISGGSVPTFVASSTGTVMVDLIAWAGARGVALNLNQSLRRASFSWRGKSHLLALATDQIKIGNQWHTMPDIVIEHQDKLWVPLTTLEVG